VTASPRNAWNESLTAIRQTWNEFWFRPATAVRLAGVRIAAGLLGIVLAWSFATDLDLWFGDGGIVSPEVLAAWRAPTALSLFDLARTNPSLWGLFFLGVILLGMLAAGAATPVVAPLAAIFWASLLHRGPMLAGPADDILAVMLWCLVVGRSGDTLSVESALAARKPGPSWRNRTALGLLRVHASVIAAAAVLSQLKADLWWEGTAAWALAARESSRVGIAGILARSELLTNLLTHAITLFELAFAAGLWNRLSRPLVAWGGIFIWPLVGLLAGEPWWGAAMAILSFACLPSAEDEASC
jgi:hypothetical protein